MVSQDSRFDHGFSSCSRTYATLCIYHDSISPRKVSETLLINPDSTIAIGDEIRSGRKAEKSGWFFGTKEKCESKDLMVHIDYVLSRLSSKMDELLQLHKSGFRLIIKCFWVSATGNGGPILDHTLIKNLSQYPIELDFDIYFDD